MGKKLLIALILSSFLMAEPALAVKRVSKSVDQPTEDKQKPPQDSQAPTPDKATPPPEHHQQGDQERPRPKQPDQPPPGGDRDRFIDRDGDGINDNLKKPPECIKRKKDTEKPPQIAPDRQRKETEKPPQREPERQRKEAEKPQKEQRAR